MCARVYPQHHPKPKSYRFYSCLDSIVCHHVANESTKMGSAWEFKTIWNPIEHANPYHTPTSIDPSGTVYWYEVYHDPNYPPNHPMSIDDFKPKPQLVSKHTQPKHAKNLWTHSPMYECTYIGSESIDLLHDSYQLDNEWYPYRFAYCSVNRSRE